MTEILLKAAYETIQSVEQTLMTEQWSFYEKAPISRGKKNVNKSADRYKNVLGLLVSSLHYRNCLVPFVSPVLSEQTTPSFSRYCFVTLTEQIEFGQVKSGILFNPCPKQTLVLRVCSTILLKTQREKEKLLVTSNFSFSHSVFYLFGELSAIFIKFKLVVFQFGRV